VYCPIRRSLDEDCMSSEVKCPNCEGEGYTIEPVCCGNYRIDSQGRPFGCCGIPDSEKVQCNCAEHIEKIKNRLFK